MKNKKGFTLLELLIAVAIIGILVAIALPRYLEATNRSKTAADKANIRLIDTQIELYQIVTGFYPSFPNMAELLESQSYFPDGRPKCPFLIGNTADPSHLGVYSLALTGPAGNEGQTPFRMRVSTHWHLFIFSRQHEGRWVE